MSPNPAGRQLATLRSAKLMPTVSHNCLTLLSPIMTLSRKFRRWFLC